MSDGSRKTPTKEDLRQTASVGLIWTECLRLRLGVVLRGTTVLPRHRGTIFPRYQYRRLYGTF